MINKRKPFFSIVTISFNQEIYLKNCIESILNQSFKDFEYIIQDPGSTDNSRSIINSYRHDSRIRIYFEEDNSPSDGLNKGFAKAKGDFYLFLNSDDELCLDALKNFKNQIINYPNYDVYSGAAMIIDSKGKSLRLAYSDNMNLTRAAYSHCILMQQSTVFKSSIYKKVGGFNKNNLISWDGELFLDFALASAKFNSFKTVIGKYRITNNSITGSGLSIKKFKKEQKKLYIKAFKKKPPIYFCFISFFYKWQRKFLNFEDTLQRLFYGKIAGRFINK